VFPRGLLCFPPDKPPANPPLCICSHEGVPESLFSLCKVRGIKAHRLLLPPPHPLFQLSLFLFSLCDLLTTVNPPQIDLSVPPSPSQSPSLPPPLFPTSSNTVSVLPPHHKPPPDPLVFFGAFYFTFKIAFFFIPPPPAFSSFFLSSPGFPSA